MARDLVYYFDKKSPYEQHELGEIQTGFNFSTVIDGTKDSCEICVFSFNEPAIEPYTIVRLATLNLFYVISEDKVERYLNEDGSFLYKHNLSLLGAIELLNARDLTDCGFYQNRYTIRQFINRLFKLSSFEYTNTIVFSQGSNLVLDPDKVVDYIKTYQNFTPLSALRDFLDGYNCAAKLTFDLQTSAGHTYIQQAKLIILPKTGLDNLQAINVSHFDDVRETKNMSKDSFGTTTISNAENVISTKTKFYPSSGASRVVCDTSWKIDRTNGVFKLPSPIYKVNYIKIVCDNIFFTIEYSGLTIASFTFNGTMYDANFKRLLETTVANTIDNNQYAHPYYEGYIENLDKIIDNFKKFTSIKLYTCLKYDATNNKFFFLPTAPTDAKIARYVDNELGNTNSVIGCFDEETRNTTRYPNKHFWYKKGESNIHMTQGWTGALLTQNNWMRFTTPSFEINGTGTIDDYIDKYDVYKEGDFTITCFRNNRFQLRRDSSHTPGKPYNNAWRMVCEYIPMSDIKIKIDNHLETNDTDLYNQTGKQTDSVALSKLLLTHAVETSSDTITRYKQYYAYNDIPQIGQRVLVGGEKYVINNISYDVYQTENTEILIDKVHYYFECEFTISKEIATKSVMVNPDTDIRPYGIPQTFNVKRKKLFRDYYEFNVSKDVESDENYYIDLYNFISFDINPVLDQNFVMLIKAGANYYKYDSVSDDYDTPVAYNYFQIEATNYLLKKSFYVLFDFQDNNIIGYDAQSSYAGFDITRLTDRNDLISTPISYVDQDGVVESLELLITNQSNITLDDNYSLLTNRVYISGQFYNDNESNGYLAKITESDYKKDPTEVPVFEYACQLANSSNVVVGENLLAIEESATYFYGYVIRNLNSTTENNADSYADNTIDFAPIARITDAVKIEKGYTESSSHDSDYEQNLLSRATHWDDDEQMYYATRVISATGTITDYNIELGMGAERYSAELINGGTGLSIRLYASREVSVRAKLTYTVRETTSQTYTDRLKLSFYQYGVPLANNYITKQSIQTKKDLCIYRYMVNTDFMVVADITALTTADLQEINPGTLVYSTLQAQFYTIAADHTYYQSSSSEINALVLKKELVFIIRNYKLDTNNDLILYINHYKTN